MAATFSRIKDWIAEVLTYEDLNAEIDNILENLGPTGIGSYSRNLGQYRINTSPIDEDGNPVLPNDLAGEIERLRYQILAIMGTDADYWYDSPSATLSGLSTILFGDSVPASRIESIDSDSFVNLLSPHGTQPTVTLKGSTNTIVYYVNGVRFELTTDISITNMSTAPSTQNTATYADSILSLTEVSTYCGEHDTVMTLGSLGTNFTPQAGVYQAYKVTHLGTDEYFTGYYNATGTKIERARRGNFFLPDTSPSSRTILSFGDVVTLLKLAWIYLQSDNTLTLTYNTPIYSFAEPTAPAIGDMWFDLESTTWKTYSALGYVESNAVYVGQAILDSTACVAARSVEPYRLYSSTNEMDIEIDASTTALRPKNLQSTLSIYGVNHNWGARTELWDSTVLEGGGSLAASQYYYAYVKEDADFVLSTIAPNDRRGDLGGYYHPSHSWRCLGYATTSGSIFIQAGSFSFFRNAEVWFKTPKSTQFGFIGQTVMRQSYDSFLPKPQGWYPCDGTIINETNYDAVHGAGSWDYYIGTSALDGRYTPNMNALAYAKGTTDTTHDGLTPFTTSGSNTRAFSHSHTMGNHTHQWYQAAGGAGSNTWLSSGATQSITNTTATINTALSVNSTAAASATGNASSGLHTSASLGSALPTGSGLDVPQDITPLSVLTEYWIKIID